MNDSHPMTPESLRQELADEVQTARQLRWMHRIAALSLFAAYFYAALALDRADPVYLLLLASGLVVVATLFINQQRFRFPEALMRPLSNTEPEPGLRESLDALWPEIRARYGRQLVVLGSDVADAETVGRLTLDGALELIRHAHLRNWPRIARQWSWGLGLALGLVVSVCIMHVPNVP